MLRKTRTNKFVRATPCFSCVNCGCHAQTCLGVRIQAHAERRVFDSRRYTCQNWRSQFPVPPLAHGGAERMRSPRRCLPMMVFWAVLNRARCQVVILHSSVSAIARRTVARPAACSYQGGESRAGAECMTPSTWHLAWAVSDTGRGRSPCLPPCLAAIAALRAGTGTRSHRTS